MGRIVYLMTGIIAINMALLIFSCSATNPETGQCVPASSIWSYMFSPSELDKSNLWGTLFGAPGLAAIAATIIFVGSFFMKSEFPLYASMALYLVYPIASWIKLFGQISESGLFGSALEAKMVAIVLASPIIIVYIFTILDWARGRD